MKVIFYQIASMDHFINDVSDYLYKLKEDLCIGKHGYPREVVLAGDQQTYEQSQEKVRKLRTGGHSSILSWSALGTNKLF